MSHNDLTLAKNIKLLVLDVDGILTDGSLLYGESGETLKRFHTHDGMGVRLLMQTGVSVALITARRSAMVEKRAQELGIKHVFMGQDIKKPVFESLQNTLNLSANECAYMGDDLTDIPCLQLSGLAITVPNACELAKQHAQWITQNAGGHGAVREACEMILHAQNNYDTVIQQYLATRGYIV
ncbi:MAG: hypothetical protein COV52_09000 [Gammaproteobacteria bacterium CG11_big_fil_rev_8_21_14_0_20_46_22]|nr:MAG: hypothetical protein COW05_01615 [Gammaproteobacteria bacterium CG12_big_fil_rev_8_21_14_0_65_46_12]PIR10414.1 MAG: hypothetical protein COV52_09000 [Gammaproteobacteria bacterium CG11_big_fil_rev_8_21_14_0_20_46_22]